MLSEKAWCGAVGIPVTILKVFTGVEFRALCNDPPILAYHVFMDLDKPCFVHRGIVLIKQVWIL